MRCEVRGHGLRARVTNHPCVPASRVCPEIPASQAEQPLSLGQVGQLIGHPAVFALAISRAVSFLTLPAVLVVEPGGKEWDVPSKDCRLTFQPSDPGLSLLQAWQAHGAGPPCSRPAQPGPGVLGNQLFQDARRCQVLSLNPNPSSPSCQTQMGAVPRGTYPDPPWSG